MTMITHKIQFVTQDRRKYLTASERSKPQIPQARTPRIAKLMALAIRFDQLLRDGTVRDMSELSRLAHVTQPRMTQIMNLLHLAPDIQEELLFHPPVACGRDNLSEKTMRPIAAIVSWQDQREAWRGQKPSCSSRSRFGR